MSGWSLIYRKYLIKNAFGIQFLVVIIMYYRNENHSGYLEFWIAHLAERLAQLGFRPNLSVIFEFFEMTRAATAEKYFSTPNQVSWFNQLRKTLFN